MGNAPLYSCILLVWTANAKQKWYPNSYLSFTVIRALSELIYLHSFDDGDYSCGPEAADSGEDSDGQIVVRRTTRLHQSDAIWHMHGHLAGSNTWMRCTVRHVRLCLRRGNRQKRPIQVKETGAQLRCIISIFSDSEKDLISQTICRSCRVHPVAGGLK